MFIVLGYFAIPFLDAQKIKEQQTVLTVKAPAFLCSQVYDSFLKCFNHLHQNCLSCY